MQRTKFPESHESDAAIIDEMHELNAKLIMSFSEEDRPKDQYSRKLRWRFRSWLFQLDGRSVSLSLQESWEIHDDGYERIGSAWFREINDGNRSGLKLKELIACEPF
jgi:hypothetical protein